MENRAHCGNCPRLGSEVAGKKDDRQDQHPRQLSTKDTVVTPCLHMGACKPQGHV